MTVIVLGGGAAYGGGAAGPGKEDGTLTQRVEPEQTHNMQVKFPVCCPLPTKKKAANMQDNVECLRSANVVRSLDPGLYLGSLS